LKREALTVTPIQDHYTRANQSSGGLASTDR
jgi:hypothetical protein